MDLQFPKVDAAKRRELLALRRLLEKNGKPPKGKR